MRTNVWRQALERDFAERYRPSPELSCRIEYRDAWIYDLVTGVGNKGMSPLRLDAVRITHGQRELSKHENLVVSPAEVRWFTSVRISLHDLAADRLSEGQPITLDVVVEYKDTDGTPLQIIRKPWVEYRARPR